MKSQQTEKQLPAKIAKKIREILFPQYGSGIVSDAELLRIADVLFSYYPPNAAEEEAALIIEKWVSAKEIIELAGINLKRVAESMERIAGQMDRDYMGQERRPNAVITSIPIPQEFVSAEKGRAQLAADYLKTMLEDVAVAKRRLSRYVYRIVAEEGIEPQVG